MEKEQRNALRTAVVSMRRLLEKEFRAHFPAIPDDWSPYFNGLTPETYPGVLRDVIVGDRDPENVVLLEIEPEKQKTRIDFAVTERLTGIRTVCATEVTERGGRLFYQDGGREIPIRRVYNRVIFDEVERKGLDLSHIFRRELDVEWTELWNTVDPSLGASEDEDPALS